MWRLDEVVVEVVLAERHTAIVRIVVPVGVIELVADVFQDGRTLYLTGAHIQGLVPGALSRAGLNAIGRKLLVEADVDEIVIEGGTRTTGIHRGKRPRRIRFPHS